MYFNTSALIALLGICAFTSCGIIPSAVEPDLKELPSEAIERKVTSISDQDGMILQENWPDQAFWQMFEDDQLNYLIEKALCNNPSINAAEARLAKAYAMSDKAHVPSFPTLNFGANVLRLHQSENGMYGTLKAADPNYPITYFQRDMHFGFSYHFDFFKIHHNELMAAIGEVNAISAEHYAASLSIALSVAENYFRYQMNLERVTLAKRLLESAKEANELVKLKEKNGLMSLNLVNVAINQELLASQFYCEVSKELSLTGNQLQALLGGDFLEPIEKIALNPSVKPFPLPCSLSLNLIAKRPDIFAKRWRAESASYKIAAAKGAFYPNIDILGLAGVQAIGSKPLFDWGSVYGLAFGPALNLPIFSGGKLQAELDVQQSEYCMAVAEYDEAVIKATKEVLNAIDEARYATECYRLANEMAKITQEDLQIANALLSRSLKSKVDVLQAESDWLKAKDNVWQALFYSLQARLNLIQVLGGGF